MTITASAVTPGAAVAGLPATSYGQGIAGVTITAFQPLYQDASDSNKLKLGDANASATTAAIVGISAHAALAGQPIRYYTAGPVNLGAILTAGVHYVVSANAGMAAPIADIASTWNVTRLGFAYSTSVFIVDIVVTGAVVP